MILRSLPQPPKSMRSPGVPYSSILFFEPSVETLLKVRAAAMRASKPPLIVVAFDLDYECVWSTWTFSDVIDATAAVGVDVLAVPVPILAASSVEKVSNAAVSAAIHEAMVSERLASCGLLARALCSCSQSDPAGCEAADSVAEVLEMPPCSDSTPGDRRGVNNASDCSLVCNAWKAVAERQRHC